MNWEPAVELRPDSENYFHLTSCPYVKNTQQYNTTQNSKTPRSLQILQSQVLALSKSLEAVLADPLVFLRQGVLIQPWLLLPFSLVYKVGAITSSS